MVKVVVTVIIPFILAYKLDVGVIQPKFQIT